MELAYKGISWNPSRPHSTILAVAFVPGLSTTVNHPAGLGHTASIRIRGAISLATISGHMAIEVLPPRC